MEIKSLVVGPLLTNCYILISDDKSAVIDPGGNEKDILIEIGKSQKESLRDPTGQAKLKYIILTHFHPDHTLAALKIKEKIGAKILIHEADRNSLKFEADEFLKEGDELEIGKETLKVINTPGHTKGSICLIGKDFIFTGDTLFKDGYGRTDLPDGSQKEMGESLERINKLLKPGIKIYPGHGEIFIYE